MIAHPTNDGEAFWERHYQSVSDKTDGKPSAPLVRFVEGRHPGRALDLGCARGDNPVWLAKRGWQVNGVDIAPTALSYARANAERAGVSDNILLEQHDLANSFPEGSFDLISAIYLQSPVAVPAAAILKRASSSIRPGGMLLFVTHASVAPWSWSDPGTVFPTSEEELMDARLDPHSWIKLFVGTSERQATGPKGQTATVKDNIIALERR
ncbi:MAG: class I SAM-dependent methyltransferase [Pseudomonadota bacterium]